jgi:hypothetical protein
LEPFGVIILYQKYDYLWEAECNTLNSLLFLIVEPSGIINLVVFSWGSFNRSTRLTASLSTPCGKIITVCG